jgi:hypothetical protein
MPTCARTSLLRDQPRRTALVRRGRSRGVVFVEAVIIVTTMTLFFMAIIFFRSVYVKKVRTQSLARASAIAYSMGGCENNDPTAWAGRDLGGNAASSRTDEEQIPKQNPEGYTPEPKPTGDGTEKAEGIMDKLPQTGNDDSILNPVARIGLADEASVTTRDGALGPRRGFTHAVTARSHVSCGDVVRDGDFDEIVDVVTSMF